MSRPVFPEKIYFICRLSTKRKLHTALNDCLYYLPRNLRKRRAINRTSGEKCGVKNQVQNVSHVFLVSRKSIKYEHNFRSLNGYLVVTAFQLIAGKTGRWKSERISLKISAPLKLSGFFGFWSGRAALH